MRRPRWASREAALIDAPLEEHPPVQRHQLLHHLRRGQLLPDAALPAAQIHQLPQQAVVYPLLAALQYALLRVAQPVDEGFIQHLVPHADFQRPAHEVQQLLSAGAIGVRQIRLLQHLIRLVHVLGQLDGQFVLAFEVVIDIAHGAAGGLCDLLHGDVFKALPVRTDPAPSPGSGGASPWPASFVR